MRDGIPRGLPVPRKWQRVIACADRPADRGTDRVVAQLLEAIREDVRRVLPKESQKYLTKLISSVEGLLPGFEFDGALAGDAAVGRNHHISEILADVKLAVEAGAKPKAALRDAIVALMEATVVARGRQITEDLATKVKPNEIKRVIEEVDRAIAKIDFQSEATKFLEGLSSDAETPKQRLAPDEDLRRPRQ
jgi:hypothetical protein